MTNKNSVGSLVVQINNGWTRQCRKARAPWIKYELLPIDGIAVIQSSEDNWNFHKAPKTQKDIENLTISYALMGFAIDRIYLTKNDFKEYEAQASAKETLTL